MAPAKPHILLVQDSAEDRSIVDRALQDVCTMVPAQTLADARERVRLERFDLILLEVAMPDGNSYELCSELNDRIGQRGVPVIFLTSNSTADEVLSGFLAGGTDYIKKPIHPLELRARIEARLRTCAADGARPTTVGSAEWLFSGNLRFNLIRRDVQIETPQGCRRLSLTPSEFRLLCYFARHAGEIISRQTLLSDVWGERAAAMSARAIDVHICQLRKKMPRGPCRIEAIYGAGYRYADGSASTTRDLLAAA